MLPAFGMALCLHIAVFLSLPYLNHPPVPPPLRVEIDLTQATLQPVALPPQPTPPQPEPSKPKPVSPKTISQPHQQALPLLTARADIPPTPQDKVVPDIPANQPPVPIVPTAPTSTSTDSAPAETVTATAATAQTVHSEEADPNEAWQGYGQMLYEMASKNKAYPQIAIRRRLQGRVKVSARFNMGKLVELTLLEPGSGYQVLDNAALEMLRKAVSALPIKGQLEKKSFTIIVPVDFKLEG